jgi:cytochrome c oxidase subunit 2
MLLLPHTRKEGFLPGAIEMRGLVLLATGGSATENLSIFDPASPPADSIRQLSVLVLAITGAIFVVVELILFYSVFRFRRPAESAGPAGNSTEPPQVYGSKPIEIAWTAAPALIVFVIALVTVRTEWQVNVTPPQPQEGDNTLFVTVVGRQWWWEYQYEHYNGKPIRALGPDGRETDHPVITANELHIPASQEDVSRPVYLALKSADVCHSYWVPRLAGKTDLIPGRTNNLWFQTDRAGELFLGQCAEYCGTQHAHMLLRVQVDSPDVFDVWLANERKPAVDDPEVSEGKATFLSQSCVNCHRVRGTAASGTYAPDLTHLMSRKTLASGMVPNTPEELRRWVDDPGKIKPGCLMPAFGLSQRDVDQIVRYLLTLK